MDFMMDNNYSATDFFITPDRKCEQFLYQRGIRFDTTIKGETGWTYWVYPRTAKLASAIEEYKQYLEHRRALAGLWTGTASPMNTQRKEA